MTAINKIINKATNKRSRLRPQKNLEQPGLLLTTSRNFCFRMTKIRQVQQKRS